MQSQSRAEGQKCRASRLGKLAPCEYDTIVRGQRNYIDWSRTIARGSVCINLYLFGCKECARTRVHTDVDYTKRTYPMLHQTKRPAIQNYAARLAGAER